MVTYMRWGYTGWLGITVAAIILQFYLAGYGVFAFNGLNGFDAHFVVGDLIGIATIIGVGLAFAARVPWRITAMNGGLVLLMILQFILAHTGIQWLSALHVVNGVAVFGLAARLTWEVAHLPMPDAAAAATAAAKPTTP